MSQKMEATYSADFTELKQSSMKLESGLGSVAWAVLEMFKRGGMPQAEVESIHKKMDHYFAKPSNEECNAILKVVEERLQEDKISEKEIWYS
jgi:hypothetical protein